MDGQTSIRIRERRVAETSKKTGATKNAAETTKKAKPASKKKVS